MWNQLINKIKQLGREGLFHIFGSGVLAKVGGILSSVIVIRNLPKVSYGSFVDADNLYAYFAIFVGLGLTTAILQFCSERISEDRRYSIYRYSLKIGMLGNVLLGILILGLAALKYLSGSKEVGIFLAMMCLLPFFAYLDQYFQIILRVRLNNTAFSHTNMLYTVAHVGGNILMTMLWGVPGLITSQYLAHAISAVYAGHILKQEQFFAGMSASQIRLDRKERREFLSYGMICTITNFTSTVLVLLDVTCLGLILSDPAILADYKVAATIPSALIFVPKSLITFFYPKLVRSFGDGKQQGTAQVFQIAKMYLLVNGFIYLCLALFAPLIIWILFGKQYMNVIPVFHILSLNYLVYCARNLTGNVIAVLKKVRVNLLFSILSGLLNIGLNVALIPVLGSLGAAVATLCVTIFITGLNIVYLWVYIRRIPA